MPIGFAKSILTGGAGTGVDWANWDGSKDSTITVSSLTNSTDYGRWLGFCDFNDDYGLAFGIENQSGGTNDDIVYAKIQNSGDTLTYSGQAVHFTTSSSSWTNEQGAILKTNGGNIWATFNAGSLDSRVYSISGSTVTQHTAFAEQFYTNQNSTMFRQPGSNVYANCNTMPQGELSTLVDNGDSSSNASVPITQLRNPSGAGGMYYFSSSYIVPGFVDQDTPIRLQSATSPESGDSGDTGIPVTMDLTSTGTGQVEGTFAGLSAATFNVESSTNVVEWAYSCTPPFPTTDFNDRLLLIERQGSGGVLRMTNYKSGDTSYSQTTLTDAEIPSGDTQMNGIFVGPDNTIFLFNQMDETEEEIWIYRYNTVTNVLEKVLSVDNGEGFNQVRCKLCRWGNDRAVLMYNDNKIRLLVP